MIVILRHSTVCTRDLSNQQQAETGTSPDDDFSRQCLACATNDQMIRKQSIKMISLTGMALSCLKLSQITRPATQRRYTRFDDRCAM